MLWPGQHELLREMRPLEDGAADYDGLLELVGDKPIVLIGEASHGTHEFYHERARPHPPPDRGEGLPRGGGRGRLARRLPRQPLRAGAPRTATPRGPARLSALPGLDVAEHRGARLRRLAARAQPPRRGAAKVGFYGLDLYSLTTSIAAVIAYLEGIDPAAAGRARRRYACFEEFGGDPQAYGRAVTWAARRTRPSTRSSSSWSSCARAADYYLRKRRHRRRGRAVLRGAERAGRGQGRGVLPGDVRGRDRDLEPARHPHGRDARTARRPLAARARRRRSSSGTHNSHVGDARMTEMGSRGELNLGQLPASDTAARPS